MKSATINYFKSRSASDENDVFLVGLKEHCRLRSKNAVNESQPEDGESYGCRLQSGQRHSLSLFQNTVEIDAV